MIIEDKGKNFELCPSGAHLARCYRIVDVGTQKSEYMGEVKHLHKIMFGWEIHVTDDDNKPIRMKDGRPFAIFKNYTWSWSPKSNLRLDLQSWRGRDFTKEEQNRFDLKNVLGVWCMVNLIERTGSDGKTYVNINGITPVPAAIKQAGLPEAVNSNELFEISNPDMDLFSKFSDNLKRKIESSPEWKKRGVSTTSTAPAVEDEDDIPF